MEFDKNPNIIKFEGSKLQVMQQLTDQLATKMGKEKFNWKNDNLKKNISLAEAFNELTKNLNALGEDYVSVACNGYCGRDNTAHTRTTTTYSSNDSTVCTKNYNGYTFKSSCDYCPTDSECKKDAFPDK